MIAKRPSSGAGRGAVPAHRALSSQPVITSLTSAALPALLPQLACDRSKAQEVREAQSKVQGTLPRLRKWLSSTKASPTPRSAGWKTFSALSSLVREEMRAVAAARGGGACLGAGRRPSSGCFHEAALFAENPGRNRPARLDVQPRVQAGPPQGTRGQAP